MKKLKILFIIVAAAAVALCGCAKSNYKAKGLVSSNNSDGWSCSFDSMEGNYSVTFNINSPTLRIESSVQSGKMEICLMGNGELDTYDGSNFNESIPVEKYGDSILYITLKCSDAQKGSVHVVWEE